MKLAVLWATCFLSCLPLVAMDWKPIPPEDLALTQARVDPQADAEVLLWDVSVSDQAVNNQYPHTIYSYYVRLKIFTDRGATTFKAPDVEYSRNQHVSDVAGRTIQPDGSTQEMSKSEILEHVLQKRKGRKDMAISLAMPKVQKGTIIEYHWREYHEEEVANYVQLPAGREIPVEHVVYHIKPLVNPYFPYQMGYMPFNTTVAAFKPEPGGFYTTGIDNIQAFHEEEDAPPELDVMPWVLIYYQENRKESPDQYWKTEGKHVYASYKDQIKVNGQVKALAEEVVSGAKSPEEQVALLYAFCQKKIKNVNGPDVTDAERQKAKLNKNSADTLERKIGTGMDIQLAFAALVRAIGLESRVALLADRELKFFDKAMMNRYFLPVVDIAVQFGDNWKLYDVTSMYLLPGKLRWQEEGVPALITDSKDPQWVVTPLTDPALSRMGRTAVLTLGEDGGVSGSITEALSGHPAEEWRARNLRLSAAQREEGFKSRLREHYGAAEVSQIELPDPADLSAPPVLRCHIKVDGYAMRTGKRLIFTPAFFKMNEAPRYSASTRQNDLYFRYGWSETEDIQVATPEGFELDHADAPSSLTFAPFGAYKVSIRVAKNLVLYHRELTFGAKDRVTLVGKKGFPQIKAVFDTVRDRDSHMLTLKSVQTAASAEAH